MSRAMVYVAFFDALEAICKRGLEIGKRFGRYRPADLDGLCAAFLDFVPDKGRLFAPEVCRLDDQGLEPSSTPVP